MADELDLGLPPSSKKPWSPPPERPIKEGYSWRKYTAKNRRFCDLCIREAEKVQGVPKNALNHAGYTEDGPEGRYWLCEFHCQDRRVTLGYEAEEK